MGNFSVKKVSKSAKMPEYDNGVFTLYADTGTNMGLQAGKTLVVPSGVSVVIPSGHAGIVSLAKEFMGTNAELVLAEGVNILPPESEQLITVKVVNTGTTTRIVRRDNELCSLVVVPLKEFSAGGVDDGSGDEETS